jgi:hypothetical protein
MHRLKLTRVNRIKLKTSTRIPAQLIAGTGIDITREAGEYTIAVDDDYVALATEAAEAAQTAAEAAETAAETASTAAVAAAAEAVAAAAATNSKLAVYNTFALAEASSPTAAIEKIRILGYYAPGDGGDGEYRLYTGSDPAHGANILCANGTKFTLDHPLEVYAEQFGAVGDYDFDTATGTDDTDALRRWAAYTCATKRLLAKAYLYTETIDEYTLDCTYEGVKGQSFLVCESTANGGVYTLAGSVFATATDPTQLPDLHASVPIAPSSTNIDLASSIAANDLQPGDIVIVYNPTDYSYSGFRDYYRDGEMFEVKEIDTGTAGADTRIYTTTRARGTFDPGDVDVYFFRGQGVTIRGINFVGPPEGTAEALRLRLLSGVVLEDVAAEMDSAAVGATSAQIDRCFNVNGSVVGNSRGGDGTNDQYTWIISNCTRVRLRTTGDSTWHHLAIGGNEGNDVGTLAAVPNRDITIHDSVLDSLGTAAPGSDIHGNSERVLFDKCVIQNGAVVGGKDIIYRDCYIQGGEFASGACVYGAEMRGGQYLFDGCVFETTGDPSAISRGVIDFGGNSTAFGVESEQDAKIEFRNCVARIDSAATFIIRMANESTTDAIDIDVDMRIEGAASASSLLRYGGVASVAKASAVTIRNCDGLRTGATLLAIDGAASPIDSNTVLRMPVQSGVTTMATANGVAATVATKVDFKWIYPDVPIATAAMSLSAIAPVQNSKGILPYLHALDSDGIRPAISSHDGGNWNGIVSVEMHWSVGPGIKGYK